MNRRTSFFLVILLAIAVAAAAWLEKTRGGVLVTLAGVSLGIVWGAMPGLSTTMAMALLIGLSAAKALAWWYDKPLVGVDHIQAHLHASFMHEPELPLPCLTLVEKDLALSPSWTISRPDPSANVER